MFDSVTLTEFLLAITLLGGVIGVVGKIVSPVFKVKEALDELSSSVEKLRADVQSLKDDKKEGDAEVEKLVDRVDELEELSIRTESKLTRNEEEIRLILKSLLAILSDNKTDMELAQKELKDYLLKR